ncbi:hypothetical protein AEGHOMDF_3032 [Methylobacterium soli]|nr:hypothetical protein AEGHOMDF_3032 [Methylobacterium soli]
MHQAEQVGLTECLMREAGRTSPRPRALRAIEDTLAALGYRCGFYPRRMRELGHPAQRDSQPLNAQIGTPVPQPGTCL